MNQIKRIIHSTLCKVLVVCTFALALLAGTSAAVDFPTYSSTEPTKRISASLTFTTFEFPGARATGFFKINNNGQIVGRFLDSSDS
jgi:hypothetical protein